MESKNYDNDLNKLIRESMELSEEPSWELNNSLKAAIYQRESAIRKTTATHSISLWFVPMILNVLIFLLFAILSLLVIQNPYFAKLAAGVCGYISIAGIIITAVGIKRTNMKEAMAVRIQKRGVLV